VLKSAEGDSWTLPVEIMSGLSVDADGSVYFLGNLSSPVSLKGWGTAEERQEMILELEQSREEVLNDPDLSEQERQQVLAQIDTRIEYLQERGWAQGLGILALNEDGEVCWQLPMADAELTHTQAIAPDGNIVAMSESGVTIAHDGHTVMKIDRDRGEILWEAPVSVPPAPSEYDGYDPSMPVVADDGTIYVADLSGVHAFSPNGVKMWTYCPQAGEQPWLEGPVPRESWPPALGPDGTVYVCLMRFGPGTTTVVALSLQGELLWRRDEQVEGPPIVDAEGTVYLGQGYGETGYSYPCITSYPPYWLGENTILAVNPDGSTKWVFSSPDEIDVGEVLCMDNDGNLVVRGSKPGDSYWTTREFFFWLGDG